MNLASLQKKYPNIVKQFGSNWFTAQLSLPESKRHDILTFMKNAETVETKIVEARKKLSSPGVTQAEKDNLPWKIEIMSIFQETLELIEFSLSELDGYSRLSTLVKEFKGPYRKFLSTISVAVLASFLKTRGVTTLFPSFKVGTKKKTPDLAVDLAGRPIYIKVTTPAFPAIPNQSITGGVMIKERAPGQILDEFKDNFKELVTTGFITIQPLIITLDCHWTEIDDFSVQLAFDSKGAI